MRSIKAHKHRSTLMSPSFWDFTNAKPPHERHSCRLEMNERSVRWDYRRQRLWACTPRVTISMTRAMPRKQHTDRRMDGLWIHLPLRPEAFPYHQEAEQQMRTKLPTNTADKSVWRHRLKQQELEHKVTAHEVVVHVFREGGGVTCRDAEASWLQRTAEEKQDKHNDWRILLHTHTHTRRAPSIVI